MITLLRKLRRRLLSENNFSSYLFYAIGEIFLVVIGILIALQVNNWNQNRLEKKKEVLLLKEIHTEFNFNKTEMEETIELYKKARKDVSNIISMFPIQPDHIDPDSLAAYLNVITFNPSFDVSRGSIAALKNSSSFEIISNEELRTLLLRFDDLVADYADRESRSKNYSLDYIEPYLASKIPKPYTEGIRDPRVDLRFLLTIDFENLIKSRLQKINNFMQILENPKRPLVKSIHRIIELSDYE